MDASSCCVNCGKVFKINKKRKSFERQGLASFLTQGKDKVIIADLIANESLIKLSPKSINTKFICEDCLKLLRKIKLSSEQIKQSQDTSKLSKDTFQSRWKDGHVDVVLSPKTPAHAVKKRRLTIGAASPHIGHTIEITNKKKEIGKVIIVLSTCYYQSIGLT